MKTVQALKPIYPAEDGWEEDAREAQALIGFSPAEDQIVEDKSGKYVLATSIAWIKLSTSFRLRLLGKLKGAKLSVFLCLCLHINDHNECHPTIATIAKEADYSEREVIRCVRELSTMGLVSVLRSHRRNNSYSINRMASNGHGNPLGEKDVAKVTLKVTPTSPQEEPYKKNQILKTPLAAATSEKVDSNKSVTTPPSMEDPWEGFEPQVVHVPAGSRARRDDYFEDCDQCRKPLDQDADYCLDCHRPVKWTGSAIADKRYKRQKAKAADGKAKELRAMMVTGSTSAYVLALACATSPSGKCEFAKGEADRLEAYAAAYGVTVVTNLASKLKSDGDRGRGLIKHLINALESQAFEKAAPVAAELTYEQRVARYA